MPCEQQLPACLASLVKSFELFSSIFDLEQNYQRPFNTATFINNISLHTSRVGILQSPYWHLSHISCYGIRHQSHCSSRPVKNLKNFKYTSYNKLNLPYSLLTQK